MTVAGSIEVATSDASDPTLLGFRDGAAPNAALAAQVGDLLRVALDAHLDAVQHDAPDLSILGAGWVEADPVALAALTTALADTWNPVVAARYAVTVQFEAGPTLASAAVFVDRFDGTTANIEVLFDVSGDQPVLTLVGGGAA